MLKLEKLFASSIGSGLLPKANLLNKRLLTDIQELYRNDRMGQQWSRKNYREGYTSYASLNDLHHRTPTFMDFQQQMEPFVEKFVKSHHWAIRGLRLELTSLWMNIMPKNSYHTLHLHPQSAISGTYYVSTPKGSIALKLEDPRMPMLMSAPVRELYHSIEPKAGKFVLFESWLRHEVPPNQSAEPRISLSFNYSFV